MEKKRTFENKTKIIQIYYDRFGNPITVMPGKSYTEDLSGAVNVNLLIKQEMDRRRLETDVDEQRRVRKMFAMIRVAKTVEELAKLREGETNQDVLDSILVREKEMFDDAGRAKGKA